MDIDTGKLYTPEEIETMTKEELAKIVWVSRAEYAAMKDIPERKRVRALEKMRQKEKQAKKKKRKAQARARRKNR